MCGLTSHRERRRGPKRRRAAAQRRRSRVGGGASPARIVSADVAVGSGGAGTSRRPSTQEARLTRTRTWTRPRATVEYRSEANNPNAVLPMHRHFAGDFARNGATTGAVVGALVGAAMSSATDAAATAAADAYALEHADLDPAEVRQLVMEYGRDRINKEIEKLEKKVQRHAKRTEKQVKKKLAEAKTGLTSYVKDRDRDRDRDKDRDNKDGPGSLPEP